MEGSRIAAARARAAAAKWLAVAAAVFAFGVSMVLARASHPAPAGQTAQVSTAEVDDGSSASSIAPAPQDSAPQVQTGSS
jgi:hypothetical protein